MSDESHPRAGRRATDPVLPGKSDPAPRANLPAVIARPEPKAAAFDAQLYTQGTQKRGLRGGKPVLDHARAAYLETEWSGPADRRPPKGMLTATKV